MHISRRHALRAVGLAALAAMTACGSDAGGPRTGVSASDLAGWIKGAGATSQADAQEAWMNAFMDAHWDTSVEYAGGGSGAGRTKFLQGAVDFAGSDAAMSADEVASAGSAGVIEVPLYISPIALAYNLPGMDAQTHVNMTPEVIAKVFNRTITMWNDPEIVALNPETALPGVGIITVHRSDDSGTTKSFTRFLSEAAPSQWTHGAHDAWPYSGGQSGDGTTGVVSTIRSAEGAIGYADASKVAEGMGTVAVGSPGAFVTCTAQAAAATLDSSGLADDATETRLVYEVDYRAVGSYPIILVSYVVARQVYDDAEIGGTVKAYVQFMASAEGQELAARAAGSAPLSEDLRGKVMTAIDTMRA